MPPSVDIVALAQDLIRCPSVTPQDAGALTIVEQALTALGFTCRRLRFGAEGALDADAPVDNLFATIGTGARGFAFAGHTDVVPPGNPSDWSHPPFSGTLSADRLWGRGAADMKGAIAAFIAAVARFLTGRGVAWSGRIGLIITGDEEGYARNGTVKMVEWLQRENITFDACLVGEPTSVAKLGDMVKNGRRGSMTADIVVQGIQGHTAYPQRADNPAHRLVAFLGRLVQEPLDSGTEQFEPSTLQITTIDIGNTASNVIPARATARVNIRFNDRHTGASLLAWLRAHANEIGGDIVITPYISGEAFLTPPGPLLDLVQTAIQKVVGDPAAASTGGGTSDARFLRFLCPTVEFGLPGATMHKIDESVALSDLTGLTDIYHEILQQFFASR